MMIRDQIIQFNAPVLKQWKQEIEATGATILQPMGQRKIVVSIPNEETKQQLETLDYIDSIVPYTPKVRVQTQYLENLGQEATPEAIKAARLKAARTPQSEIPKNRPLPGILIANFFTEEDCDRASHTLENEGIRIAERSDKTELVLDVSSKTNALELLQKILEETGLQSLQEKAIPRLFNDQACRVIAKDVIPSNPHPNPNNLSLTGEGEIIAIADTGLDTGDENTLHLDFQDRVKKIQSYPISPDWDKYVLNPSSDDGASDKYTGHGTHVAGSALGNGEQAKLLGLSEIPSGIAPQAQLVFQAIEQTARWNQIGITLWLQSDKLPPNYGLFGIPNNLKDLFQDAYDEGARIHSNSWGGGYPGEYDRQCYKLDQFVWEHKDFLVVVAAGNDGKQKSSRDNIEQGSITSPGTAKNCLTVGASENNRLDFPDAYGNWWPEDFPYDPIKSDPMSDSIDDIAAFSSRGPCEDERRKPDVVAPGTFILSTRSSQIPRNHFAWGAYSLARQHYMYMGGTSMATPLVAGCAALVRQYLREEKEISNPSAALIKAILIHSAQYMNYRHPHPSSEPFADDEQGWGRVDLATVLNPSATTQVIFIDQSQGLETEDEQDYEIEVIEANVPLKATLVYSDYPGDVLQNNLNLTLISPSSEEITNHERNNVEQIVISEPETGQWTVKVTAAEVQFDTQDYALVISGAIQDNSL